MIDVVVPAYKVVEHNLVESLESRLFYFQNCEVVERIVLVSDWPEDNLTLERIALIYSKVVLVKASKNLGQAQARNRGFSETNSSYIVFLDQDDNLQLGDTDWTSDIVFFSTYIEAEGVVKKYFSTILPFIIARVESINSLFPLMLTNIRVSPGSFAIRRNIFETIGGFPELVNRGSDDYGFLIRAMLWKASISYCDTTKFKYHIHDYQSRDYLNLDKSIREYLTIDNEILPWYLRAVVKFRLTIIGSILGKIISKIITL